MKKFNIIKHDSHEKIDGQWERASGGFKTQIIATVEGTGRREAFKTYCETISKSYYERNFRDLQAKRYNRNKKRRLEILEISKEVKHHIDYK